MSHSPVEPRSNPDPTEVHGSHFELMGAGCKLHRHVPFTEGIFAEAWLSAAPAEAFPPSVEATTSLVLMPRAARLRFQWLIVPPPLCRT
jgi:hypothetical protein